MTVAGTIHFDFDAELRAMMLRGRQFRLTCELRADDTDTAASVGPPWLPASETSFRVSLPARRPNIYGASTSTAARPFDFGTNVAPSILNEDDSFFNRTDDIYARLYLWTRRSSSVATWSRVTLQQGRFVGLTYYESKLVQRAF